MKSLKEIKFSNILMLYIMYGVIHIYTCYVAYTYTSLMGAIATFCAPFIGPIVWTYTLAIKTSIINPLSILLLIITLLIIKEIIVYRKKHV
jgi:hypothetical protein